MPKIKDFSFVRGDTVKIGIRLKNTEAVPDEVWFSVKKSAGNADYIFQKNLADGIGPGEEEMTYTIRIAPEDTQALPEGKYRFDLEMKYGDDIYTPLIGTINLIADVTKRPLGGG